MNLELLKEPFSEKEIEWRVAQSGVGAKGVWAKGVAYIDARAVMNRLDAVCGMENWSLDEEMITGVTYTKTIEKMPKLFTTSAIICSIGIKVDGEWISKCGVSDPTDVEPVKGMESTAIKRAGVPWGIGRYLYDVEADWLQISDKNQGEGWTMAKSYDRKSAKYISYWWKPKPLTDEYLPHYEQEWFKKELAEIKDEVSKIMRLVGKDRYIVFSKSLQKKYGTHPRVAIKNNHEEIIKDLENGQYF